MYCVVITSFLKESFSRRENHSSKAKAIASAKTNLAPGVFTRVYKVRGDEYVPVESFPKQYAVIYGPGEGVEYFPTKKEGLSKVREYTSKGMYLLAVYYKVDSQGLYSHREVLAHTSLHRDADVVS